VRLVNNVDREHYQGYELHAKDCRATFLEFNHTPGSQALQVITGLPVSTASATYVQR
jgi:hypothetical protein